MKSGDIVRSSIVRQLLLSPTITKDSGEIMHLWLWSPSVHRQEGGIYRVDFSFVETKEKYNYIYIKPTLLPQQHWSPCKCN